jgi:hypothetical protein
MDSRIFCPPKGWGHQKGGVTWYSYSTQFYSTRGENHLIALWTRTLHCKRNDSVQYLYIPARTALTLLCAEMANADVVVFNTAAFITSLFLLEFGADKFIDHTAIVARRINVSQAVIGLLTAGAEWEEVVWPLSSNFL